MQLEKEMHFISKGERLLSLSHFLSPFIRHPAVPIPSSNVNDIEKQQTLEKWRSFSFFSSLAVISVVRDPFSPGSLFCFFGRCCRRKEKYIPLPWLGSKIKEPGCAGGRRENTLRDCVNLLMVVISWLGWIEPSSLSLSLSVSFNQSYVESRRGWRWLGRSLSPGALFSGHR